MFLIFWTEFDLETQSVTMQDGEVLGALVVGSMSFIKFAIISYTIK